MLKPNLLRMTSPTISHSRTPHTPKTYKTHIIQPSRVSVTFLLSSHNGKEVIEGVKHIVPLRLLWNWHVISLMWRLRRGSSR